MYCLPAKRLALVPPQNVAIQACFSFASENLQLPLTGCEVLVAGCVIAINLVAPCQLLVIVSVPSLPLLCCMYAYDYLPYDFWQFFY